MHLAEKFFKETTVCKCEHGIIGVQQHEKKKGILSNIEMGHSWAASVFLPETGEMGNSLFCCVERQNLKHRDSWKKKFGGCNALSSGGGQ